MDTSIKLNTQPLPLPMTPPPNSPTLTYVSFTRTQSTETKADIDQMTIRMNTNELNLISAAS